MNDKRLYKSNSDVVLSGVLGGISEYLNTDPTLIRFLFVMCSLVGGGGVLLIMYIVASLIMPINKNKKANIK